MPPRDFDPLRLDVAAFAKAAGELAGHWSLAQLDRLAASSMPGVAAAGEVRWSARGEQRQRRSGEAQVWLQVTAQTQVALECQRCLKPVELLLHVARQFLFVHGEDAAAELDTDSDDDVLALTRALDLRELIEDELLLAMPIVPRHPVCPDPLVSAVADDLAEVKPNPFSVLAGLKRTDLN